MLSGKAIIVFLTIALIKKTQYKRVNIFRNQNLRGVKVELDLSNYATKADLKTAAGVDTSRFARKVDLANLRSNVEKLDIDKIKKIFQLV